MNLSDRKLIERAVMADTGRECIYGSRQPCMHPNCLDADFDKKSEQFKIDQRHSVWHYAPMTGEELLSAYYNGGLDGMVAGLRNIEQSVLARVETDDRQIKPLVNNVKTLEYLEALEIAKYLWRNHYSEISPNWSALPDLSGLLSQISNMVAGILLTRK